MAVGAQVIWRPERLNASLAAAAIPARQLWAKLAGSRCVSRRVGASVHVLGDRVAATHPLAPIIESGSGPHEIDATDKILKLANGGFAASVQHPGTKAHPFLRTTLPAWPPLYRRVAAGALRVF